MKMENRTLAARPLAPGALLEYRDHGSVDDPVARHQFLTVDRVADAGKISDDSSRLPENDDPCRHIPGIQTNFPEAVKPTSCHVTKVKCGTPCPTQTLRLQCKPGKMDQVVVRGFSDVIGKAGYQQRSVELINFRYR